MNSETTTRWLILGGLLLLTLWLVWTMPAAEDDGIIEVVKPTRSIDTRSVDDSNAIKSEFMLTPRTVTVEKSVDVFGLQAQKVIKRVPAVVNVKPAPVSKPVAPSLPFKYVGKLEEGGIIKVFLMQEQVLHIVRQGDKIGKNYQLKRVNEQQITMLYLPLNITQTMSIK